MKARAVVLSLPLPHLLKAADMGHQSVRRRAQRPRSLCGEGGEEWESEGLELGEVGEE